MIFTSQRIVDKIIFFKKNAVSANGYSKSENDTHLYCLLKEVIDGN